MSLTKLQIQAAHRTGQDVCVVAGPGSGKTSVLIERFAWLVRVQGVSPTAILAITFTEKAATEVKQRLVKEFAGDPEIRAQIERAYVSTIHGFCQRLLKENAIAAGLDPEFRITDEGENNALLRACAEWVLDQIYEENPELLRSLLKSLAVTTFSDGAAPDLAASLMHIYEAIRTAGAAIDDATAVKPAETAARERLDDAARELLAERYSRLLNAKQRAAHEAVAEWAKRWLDFPDDDAKGRLGALSAFSVNLGQLKANTRFRQIAAEIKNELIEGARAEVVGVVYEPERRLACEALARMDEEFRKRKRAAGLLDFSDLEEQAILLLGNNPALRERVRSGFDQILMDELQDTNPLQWTLINLIRSSGGFFAVGDVNQSIFGFRYADPAVFQDYRESLRSRGLAVDELRVNWRSRPEILNFVNCVFSGPAPGIDSHVLTTERTFMACAEPPVELLIAAAEDGEELEAQHLASRILELRRPFRDITVLVRSYDAMQPVSKALEEAGVPWIVSGGRTFFEAREVIDLVCLLKTIANPRDDLSLLAVLRSPFVNASDEDLLRMAGKESLSQGLEDWPHEDRIVAFRNLLHKLRSIRGSLAPDRLVRAFVDASGYSAGLSARARSNIDKFCVMVREYGAIELPELIRNIEIAEPLAEAPPEDIGDVVRLMTVHQSKGLEFAVVFLPALHRGRMQDSDVISYSREFGVGMKWRDPSGGKGISDPARLRWEDAQKAEAEAESNRLLYVAATRAKEHLCLSYASQKTPRGDSWGRLVYDRLRLEGNVQDEQSVVIEGVRVLRTISAPAVAGRGTQYATAPQPVALEAPALSEQYDSTASATSVSLFHSCPRKYYLARYLRWKQPRGRVIRDGEEEMHERELDASEFGDQVHALLAGSVLPGALTEAIQLADRFHNSVLGRRAANAAHAYREWDFLATLEDVVLRGQVDLWFEHKGELIIVDYKTDEVRAPAPPDRLAPYQLQLQLYALALEQHLRRPPDRAYLHFLKPDEVVEVDISPLQLNAARAAVREFREAQDAVEFPLKPAAHCFRCDFFGGLCPAKVGNR